MEYIIKPFLVYTIQNDSIFVVQTKNNSLVTKNKQLIDFLYALEEYRVEEITDDELSKFTNNDEVKNSLISLLLENNIFEKKKIISPNFTNIYALSNDSNFTEGMTFFAKHKIQSYSLAQKSNYLDLKDSLVFVCLNPFSLSELKELINELPNQNNIYKFIFPYNNSLYISNYYSKSWGNPCPLCFFYSLEAQIRGSQVGRETLNFQLLVDLFYKEKGHYSYDGLLEKEDWLPVYNVIFNDLSNKEKFAENVDEVIEINFFDGSKNYDTCYHWEMCDCYE